MNKTKKVIAIVLAVILIPFLIWNVLWICYRQVYFSKIIQNSDLFSRNPDTENGYLYQEIDPDTGTIYSYSVFFPHYLRFDNNYCCLPSLNIEENGMYSDDYFAGLTIKPQLFQNNRYIVTLYDLKTANELFLAGKNNGLEYDTYELEVNDKLEIIRELTPDGASVMKNAYSEVEEILNKAKAMFVNSI